MALAAFFWRIARNYGFDENVRQIPHSYLGDQTKVIEWLPPESDEEKAFKEGLKNVK